MDLTDHQLKLLKIIDCVRWGEEEGLGAYNLELLTRAYGNGDKLITFEWEQAAEWARAWDLKPPPSPEPGPLRSPWMETWDVPFWRVEAIELDESIMNVDWAAVSDATVYGPDGQPVGSM